ncbi:hypothetical protein GCM10008955_20000 [Deinococcus malanensis]|uniref:Uncharacterized protein n=1 Tax=Deinococcus malanensis TaxID=1706855 RepID=A0ABQ2EU07_9DEIO|nr:hypothetical protein [Deinococcus malanensis]GGK26250.1 hypothetical protein GCM10008955_20000 [Deinococcus malanensis]
MTGPDHAPAQTRTDKGVRGFELDLHVTFTRPLPEAEALSVLLALEGFRVELYRPHPSPTRPAHEAPAMKAPAEVPSARLNGPLRDPDTVRAGLSALLQGPARYIEVGVRGFLRSATGQTEWMPWRRNAVLPRTMAGQVTFEEGVKFILE